MAQGIDQHLFSVVGQPGHGLLAGFGGEIPHPPEQRLGVLGQIKAKGPAVAGIGPAGHQADFLQPVDQARQRG